jgi:hypothetical protein
MNGADSGRFSVLKINKFNQLSYSQRFCCAIGRQFLKTRLAPVPSGAILRLEPSPQPSLRAPKAA